MQLMMALQKVLVLELSYWSFVAVGIVAAAYIVIIGKIEIELILDP